MSIWHGLRAAHYLAVITLTIMGLGGCANNNWTMQSWVGKTESELIKYWGKPDITNTFENGETIHTWIHSEINASGPHTCQKSVIINDAHTITRGSSRGCPSLAIYRQ